MTNKPDITYRLTTSNPITNDDLLEAANEIVDLREKIQLLELQYSVLLAKYDNAAALLDEYDSVWDYELEQTCCDNCGEFIREGTAHIFTHLPCDIASANAGESAAVCRNCCEKIEADCNNGKFRTTDMS